MDYADGGDLSKKILEQKKKDKYFTENQILDWFTQICLAIKHIHDRKILHRDIKSQNIFLTKNNMVKLGDFGIAKCFNNTIEKAKTIIGTPYYLSPEIINNEPYGFKSDIWALGVLLYEMCMLKMPFDASNIPQLYLKIITGNYFPFNNNSEFSNDIKNLINELLTKDPKKRPSINNVLKNKLIKMRIGKFLSKNEIDIEFSHTILHKFNVLNSGDNNNYNNNSNRNSQKPVVTHYRDKELNDLLNLKKDLAGIAINKLPERKSTNSKKSEKVLITNSNINNNNNINNTNNNNINPKKIENKKIVRNNPIKKEISERNFRNQKRDISDKDSKDNNSKILKTESSNNGSKSHKNGKYSERSSRKDSRENNNLHDFMKKMRKQNKKKSKELGVIWMKGMENILDDIDNDKEDIIIHDIKKQNKENNGFINNYSNKITDSNINTNNNINNNNNNKINDDNSLLEFDKIHCEDVNEEEVQNLFNNLMIGKTIKSNNLNLNNVKNNQKNNENNINDEMLEELNNDLGREIVFDMANLIKSQINDDMTQYDYDFVVNYIKDIYDKKGLANAIIEKAINKIPDIYYLMLVEKITVN